MKINQNLKARVYKFYYKNIENGKMFVANHFLAEGCSRSTIYRHIRSRESGKQIERKKGSGRIPLINTPKKLA
jgi:biotin operon repressor